MVIRFPKFSTRYIPKRMRPTYYADSGFFGLRTGPRWYLIRIGPFALCAECPWEFLP